jgi:hypothetical protein
MTIQTNDRNERIDPNPGFILKPEARSRNPDALPLRGMTGQTE